MAMAIPIELIILIMAFSNSETIKVTTSLQVIHALVRITRVITMDAMAMNSRKHIAPMAAPTITKAANKVPI